jgi:NAD(P)-dependent dehydrogenase (short-subunit alcohol dehydrogenase family)
MADRAALVSGASQGIGLALARMLGEEGYGLTIASRQPDKLEPAADELRNAGFDIQAVTADLSGADCEAQVRSVVAAHRERFGRLDVLCNNAGVALRSTVDELQTKRMDVQFNANLRQTILFYRECHDMLLAAGAEHGNAQVINTSSILGKTGGEWLGVYSAVKAALIGWTQAMNKELGPLGIKSCALCPALVNTSLSDRYKGDVPPESMIQVSDIAEMVRAVLRLSPGCLIPEIIFDRAQA